MSDNNSSISGKKSGIKKRRVMGVPTGRPKVRVEPATDSADSAAQFGNKCVC